LLFRFFHFAALSNQADEASDSPSSKKIRPTASRLLSLSQPDKFSIFSSYIYARGS
jgi:hypothetical protein